MTIARLLRSLRCQMVPLPMLLSGAAACLAIPAEVGAIAPCRVEVVDKENGWPVPLVELRTTHDVALVTDNAGVVAIDQPELLDREVYFHIAGHGYAPRADGFGYRGVRLTPRAGETLRVEVERSIIAKRLGRLTGAGIFAESQKLGEYAEWRESGVFGCDSIQLAEYRGRLFWSWGDTDLARYPLGVFHMSSATTSLRPLETFEPPIALQYDYFTDEQGIPRGVAKMAGDGPTWLSGYATVPDAKGNIRFGATYSKIRGYLEAYEIGLCVWNDETENFEHLKTLWTKSSDTPKPPPFPDGHVTTVKNADGAETLLFGNPLPMLRCPATFEAWQDPTAWERLEPQKSLPSATSDENVVVHTGSIAWSEFRRRWVTVFMQAQGKPSAFGELWYAEADAPTGPWGPAVKVLSHDNYTFYNPRLHPELVDSDSPFLLFEGTYTATFADRPAPTPRYDYNQILYRLDLNDPKLAPAQGAAR
jgi:hypothetical protein